ADERLAEGGRLEGGSRLRQRSERAVGEARVGAPAGGAEGAGRLRHAARLRPRLGGAARGVEEAAHGGVVDPLDVLAVLEDDPERVADRALVERPPAEREERRGPVEALGDARLLEE